MNQILNFAECRRVCVCVLFFPCSLRIHIFWICVRRTRFFFSFLFIHFCQRMFSTVIHRLTIGSLKFLWKWLLFSHPRSPINFSLHLQRISCASFWIPNCVPYFNSTSLCSFLFLFCSFRWSETVSDICSAFGDYEWAVADSNSKTYQCTKPYV